MKYLVRTESDPKCIGTVVASFKAAAIAMAAKKFNLPRESLILVPWEFPPVKQSTTPKHQ